jgi:hypothetical protein
MKNHNLDQEIINQVIKCGCALKMLSHIYPSLWPLANVLFKNCLILEKQVMYNEVLEHASNSLRVMKGVPFSNFNFGSYNDPLFIELYRLILQIDPEQWIPLTVFPVWEYKKPRMDLCLEPFAPSFDSTLEVKRLVKRYIMSLDIKFLELPPHDVLEKVGRKRYNDGGEVKFDHVKPEYSRDSGFLYQEFLTKPLVPREVWLPGKNIKRNNAFFMSIGRQILTKDSLYPSSDIQETWERIRNKLDEFIYFDISGFGFQFPRSYLKACADAIRELYPSSVMDEEYFELMRILNNVEVQKGITKIYPPDRGIGLGYYEDLKTMVMIAILHKYTPFSVYGDQGLLGPKVGMEGVSALQHFGFIIKNKKSEYRQRIVRWSGYTMTKHNLYKPKRLSEDLSGLFSLSFHYQRKEFLRSLYEQDQEHYLKHIEPYMPFLYEKFFSYEFFKGDSAWHIDNGGVSFSAPYVSGYTRTQIVQRMVDPGVQYGYGCFVESPLSLEVSVKEASKFSKERRIAFKKTVPINDQVIEYSMPRYSFKRKNTKRNTGIFPEWLDINLFFKYGRQSGTLTRGLQGEDLYRAITQYKFSRNPFEIFVNGGYKLLTMERSRRGSCEEHLLLAQAFEEWDLIHPNRVNRIDVPLNPLDTARDDKYRVYTYLADQGLFTPPPWRVDRAKRIRSSVGSQQRKKFKFSRKPKEKEDLHKMHFFKAAGMPTSLASSIASLSTDTEVEGSSSEEEESPLEEDLDLYLDLDLKEYE